MKSSLPVAVWCCLVAACMTALKSPEAVGLLIALSQAGFGLYRCYAPVREQYHVVDHFKGRTADGARAISHRIGAYCPWRHSTAGRLQGCRALRAGLSRRFWRRQNLTTFIDQGDKAQLYADVNSA